MAEHDDNSLPPTSRFHRFRKLAGLTAQLGSEALGQGVRRFAGKDVELLSRETAEKLVATLGDLKGAAMKFGQIASMDPDLVSPELRVVLSRLQNQAPPMSYATVAKVVEAELQAPPEQLFATFDQEPMAAASLGQVHRATLSNGRKVVVKVQYPGVDRGLKGDLENLGGVVKALSFTGKTLDGTAYFRELSEQLIHELDYVREAQRVQAFASAVAPIEALVVPEVIPERSAQKVLTLEYLEGPTLQQWLQTEPDAAARLRVSRQLVLATFGPFFTARQVHGDPHPGNYLVLPDGRLGVLDFGSVRAFPPEPVELVRKLVVALSSGTSLDLVALARAAGFTVDMPQDEGQAFLARLAELSTRPLQVDHYDFAQDQMAKDTRDFMARNVGRALKVRPPADSIFFFRALGGLGQNLKSVGASGNFQSIVPELLALPELSPSSSRTSETSI
ncbi:MAG TPA: AarF/ABC1/UbiB kinase family protein [Myxococcaceae bacterium]|nr:AarF/ABC1/UbiB kinase family protein [Myxococcaceae bacterium]